MRRLDRINVEKARAVQEFLPVPWTISQTPEGWMVRRGDVVLTLARSSKPRVFKTVDGAISRLSEEVGVREFKVEIA